MKFFAKQKLFYFLIYLRINAFHLRTPYITKRETYACTSIKNATEGATTEAAPSVAYKQQRRYVDIVSIPAYPFNSQSRVFREAVSSRTRAPACADAAA